MDNKKREEGFYHVKYNGQFTIAMYQSETWTFCGVNKRVEEKHIQEIYEPRIETILVNSNMKEAVEFLQTAGRVKRESKVQDLTKPEAHGMNPLVRNFMDSTH